MCDDTAATADSERLSFFLEPVVPREYTLEINRKSLDAIRQDPSIATDMLCALGFNMKHANRVVDNLTSSRDSNTQSSNLPPPLQQTDDHVQSLDAFIVRRTLTPVPRSHSYSSSTSKQMFPPLGHTTPTIMEGGIEGPTTITCVSRVPSQLHTQLPHPSNSRTQSHQSQCSIRKRPVFLFCCSKHNVLY
jgi:hypothetical protein